MPPLLNRTAAKADTPISGSLKPTYGEFKTPSAPQNCPQTKGFSPFHAYAALVFGSPKPLFCKPILTPPAPVSANQAAFFGILAFNHRQAPP